MYDANLYNTNTTITTKKKKNGTELITKKNIIVKEMHIENEFFFVCFVFLSFYSKLGCTQVTGHKGKKFCNIFCFITIDCSSKQQQKSTKIQSR